jgi:Leucine-rich repeat (LRR) protein
MRAGTLFAVKKIGLILLSVSLLISTSCEKQDKCFNQIHGVCIPDAYFFNELIRNEVDNDLDGHISQAEAEAITRLEIVTNNITDMTGIEAFSNLDTLICGYNFVDLVFGALTSLDITNNTKLKFLDCSDNQLTSLDVSNNSALTRLDCSTNQLTSLNVSKNTELIALNCGRNSITNLDVSNNTQLTELSVSSNQLTSLNLSDNIALEELYCDYNQLNSLDLSNNLKLRVINCGDNQISSLDLSGNIAVIDLYIMNMPSLGLVCVWEPIPSQDVHVAYYGSPNVYFTTDCGK